MLVRCCGLIAIFGENGAKGLPVRFAIRICECLGIAFVYPDGALPAETTFFLVAGVVNLGTSVLDDDAQVATGQVDVLAAARCHQPNVVTELACYPNRDDELSIDHLRSMPVRSNNELISDVGLTMPKVFAYLPM